MGTDIVTDIPANVELNIGDDSDSDEEVLMSHTHTPEMRDIDRDEVRKVDAFF